MLAEDFFMQRYRGYGERAWIAWHSLDERDRFGRPVAVRQLELRSKERGEPKLNSGELWKFIYGEYAEPSWRVAQAAADVLGVDLDWLMRERGAGPKRSVDLGKIEGWPGPRKAAPQRKGRKLKPPELLVVERPFANQPIPPPGEPVRHQKEPGKLPGPARKTGRAKGAAK